MQLSIEDGDEDDNEGDNEDEDGNTSPHRADIPPAMVYRFDQAIDYPHNARIIERITKLVYQTESVSIRMSEDVSALTDNCDRTLRPLHCLGYALWLSSQSKTFADLSNSASVLTNRHKPSDNILHGSKLVWMIRQETDVTRGSAQ